MRQLLVWRFKVTVMPRGYVREIKQSSIAVSIARSMGSEMGVMRKSRKGKAGVEMKALPAVKQCHEPGVKKELDDSASVYQKEKTNSMPCLF